MSISVINWVLEHSPAKGSARLVLIVLAQFAHDDGSEAFPSVDKIATLARLTRKGAQRGLRNLEGLGAIRCTGTRKHGTRVYQVVMKGRTEYAHTADARTEDARSAFAARGEEAGGEVRTLRHGGAKSTTHTSVERSPEPSETRPDPSREASSRAARARPRSSIDDQRRQYERARRELAAANRGDYLLPVTLRRKNERIVANFEASEVAV